MAEESNYKELRNITPQSLITEKHVRATLTADKGEEALLKSWVVQDFTKLGDNYVSVVSSVKVKFSLNSQTSEASYIVKLNPCRNIGSVEEFWHMCFVKELKFYKSLIPELNSILESIGRSCLKVPKFFHGSLESGCEIVFLEDLRVRHFKMFDRKKGMDVEHLKLVLQEVGKLHATSILLDEKYKSSHRNLLIAHEYLEKDLLNSQTESDKEFLKEFQRILSNSIIVLESVAGYEGAISWVESLKPQLVDIFGKQKLSSRCNVICHGDVWNNNILFRYNESGHPIEAMLVDLQFCRYASPATELNYLLYSSVEGHVRRPNLNALFSIYYDSFKDIIDAGGMDVPFTEEELEQEFTMQNKIGAVAAMMLIPVVLVEGDDAPDLSKMTDLNEYGEHFERSIRNMVKGGNPLLAPRFLAVFDELRERENFA